MSYQQEIVGAAFWHTLYNPVVASVDENSEMKACNNNVIVVYC